MTEPGLRRLSGKIAIITGAGQGIGGATARRFAGEGATVIVAEMNSAAAERTVGDVRSLGGTAESFIGDLCEYRAAADLVDFVLTHFGQLDVLVNNVGGATSLKPYFEWDPQDIVAEMHRSILPTLWCCRAALPHMVERRYGRIVNVGADSARNGLWDRAPYNVGKGGVMALTASIARETAAFGITCNCLSPGYTDTTTDRIVERGIRTAQVSEYLERLNRMQMDITPMARPGTSDEQAAAIAFLASDDVGHITGQVLSSSGGMNMQ
jgi:dihydroxycyclohexadiene carboxylate dehydrogenase